VLSHLQNGTFIGIKPGAPSHPFKFKCPATTGRTQINTKYRYCQFCRSLASLAADKVQDWIQG
jgi:hypothetical protein